MEDAIWNNYEAAFPGQQLSQRSKKDIIQFRAGADVFIPLDGLDRPVKRPGGVFEVERLRGDCNVVRILGYRKDIDRMFANRILNDAGFVIERLLDFGNSRRIISIFQIVILRIRIFQQCEKFLHFVV